MPKTSTACCCVISKRNAPSEAFGLRVASDAAKADRAKELGAEVVIAGCTEAPLVMSSADLRVEFIDPTELLARRCVAVCLGMEAVPALP